MELPITPRVKRPAHGTTTFQRYVARLPLPAAERRALLAHGRGADGEMPAAMSALHERVAGRANAGRGPAHASVGARLGIAYGAPETPAGPVITTDAAQEARIVTMPPLNRSPMAPRRWLHRSGAPGVLGFVKRLFGAHPARPSTEASCPDSPDPRGHWHTIATCRRIVLGALVAAQTYVATYFMTSVLPYHGGQPLEIVILLLFAVLCCWVSMGFWMAIAGFFLLVLGRDRYAISATAAGNAPIPRSARTAVVMPICNENVRRVFAGLQATYESLSRTGELQRFDFFVLSDSNDPDARVAETEAWIETCRNLGAFGRVFYRWRQHRIKRKSGNVADFCRRWGRNYRYMIVLDADSVMSGACLTRLVRMMEANPGAGIIQTAPIAAAHQTLYARIQQFANRVYGPVFVAGLHFFELGEARYWGHNAIIRIAPFIQHCALARFPRRGRRGREIMSHDFVEAALMRRAGWAVWVAYDLPGSYEEMPPNLIDELKRDRRWCQGNLINLRMSWARGLHPAHRAVFVTGVMQYVSAPLWFLFLLLSTLLLAVHTLGTPEYFVHPSQLFPVWPEWHPNRGIGLYVATTMLLFLPKILGVLLIWVQGAREFGGRLRLAASMLAELVFSALLAPIRMLFHTQFVVSSILGWALQWKSPPREDAETSWGQALRHHGLHTLLGLAWAGIVYWLNPAFLWWLLPVVGALMVSVPLSVYSSRISLGRALREARFFLIPEESRPPQELRWTKEALERASESSGFVDAVVDPITNALACASSARRSLPALAANPQRQELLDCALTQGPAALDVRSRSLLLRDRVALSELHFQVWTSAAAHASWGEARSHPRRLIEIAQAEARPPEEASTEHLLAAAAEPLTLPGVSVHLPRLQG